MANVLMASSQASAGPFWRDAAFALALSGLSAACFPPRFLSDHLGYQKPDAPLAALAATLLSYVAPATGMMQVSAIIAIRFSLGAAVVVHVFGVGLNAAVIGWAARIYGVRRLVSLGLLLAVVTLAIGYAADAALPHSRGGEVDTYALDLYTRASNLPAGVFGELQRTSLNTQAPGARFAVFASLGLLAVLTVAGAVLRLARVPLLRDPVDVNSAGSTSGAWNRPLPQPALKLLGILAVVGLLVQMLYIYYPPPQEILEEMVAVRTDAIAALNSRDWELAERELGKCDYHAGKLPLAVALRGGARNNEHVREVAEVRRILGELRLAAQGRREEPLVLLIDEFRTAFERCRGCYVESSLPAHAP